MTLRAKTLVLIALTTGCLLAILYTISLSIFLGKFKELEEQNTRRSVLQVLNVLENELDELDAFNNDWAVWNDTYAFIEDRNEEYIESNLVDETFIGAKLNLMLFINTSAEIVWGKAFDYRNARQLPVPAQLLEHLTAKDRLLDRRDVENSTTGIQLVSEAAVLLSSRPILTSQKEGPIRGTLLMGRFLDDGEIAQLAEITRLSIAFRRYDDGELPVDFQAARSELMRKSSIFVRPLSMVAIAGYSLIRDIDDRPALILRADMPRDIFHQGRTAIRYLIFSLLGVGLVFCVVIMVLLEGSVLSRLSNLTLSVSSIGKRNDLSARVAISGRDELAVLAGSINEMLAALQHSEEKHRALITAVPDMIVRVHRTGTVLDSNARVEMQLATAGRQAGGDIYHLLPQELAAQSMQHMGEALKAGGMRIFEYQHRQNSGARDYEVRIVVISPDEVLEIIRDITERKQAEKALKKEALLKEIHHRVKNNLQVISSLLYLQSQEIKDERIARVFEENRNRIKSIALIHEKLYQSKETLGVNFAEYLHDLIDNLFIAYGANSPFVRPAIHIRDNIFLGMNTAILCGLIINELVSNSLKHAFPNERAGEVRVEFQAEGAGKFRLVVSDNGTGLPGGFDLSETRSLGLKLVQLFCSQLDGRLEVDRTGKTEFAITFVEQVNA